jgi:hypothetical protein
MKRHKRKEIDLSKDSMLALMQEVYNEISDQRETALRIQNKMISMLKEPEDMTLIGPVVEKQQKIINDCVDKKLQLTKLQASIWDKASKKPETFSVADFNMDDEAIQNLLANGFDNAEDKYKLNK